MKALSPVNERCGVARSLVVLGERWTLLIVRDVMMGITRFSDIRARLEVAPDILSDRLAKLIELGVLERRVYKADGARTREDYQLTPIGRQLSVVLCGLQDWGDRNVPNGRAPSWQYIDARSGEPVRVEFVGPDGVVETDQVTMQVLEPETDAASALGALTPTAIKPRAADG
ncbi:helix-turn-helix domain-containing protein [Leifsonia shinshuensis]|uniref:winged helix-turn-helix transcriptional regulator n=1 Tax=Leifsonia shinshuensis TaxID=150026 RepID=UPI00285EDCFB|nr:helix-turn-helix domain-containing protein [Leifsonia shinshuensis]MDR6972888.1 DNA-binding HxlR family transcriptional regulator [Leifsonia shinshuensis]